jgi:hypothetical protein
MEEHIAHRNVEQLFHAGKTPLGCTELGDALGHTGDTPLAVDILDDKAYHPALTNKALHDIVKQLRRHPVIHKIIKPVITVEDFRSAVKCVPENVKLLSLPQPQLREHTDAQTNPSAQRATQLRSVLARVCSVSRQNLNTTTVP